MQNQNIFKSGFVTILGAPNVGKSTLLNRILGQKISITSKKAQTTRNRILGIRHEPAAQIVFLDTPGIHDAENTLNIRMKDTAVSAMGDADLILFVTDISTPDSDSETLVVRKLEKQKKPVILVINKTDLVRKPEILTAIEKWAKIYSFEAVVPLSAEHGDHTDALVEAMVKLLPPGPPYFPEDALTDMPERFIAAEMIREKVFRFTGEEIPYSTAVTVEEFSEKPDLVSIHATIHLERDSQKGIVIGKNGTKLKQIGSEARKEIERMVGVKVFLKLFVRVEKNWTKDTKALQKFGY